MVTIINYVQYPKMLVTRDLYMHTNQLNRNEMKIESIFIDRRRNEHRNEDSKIDSKKDNLTPNRNHAMKGFRSHDSRSAGCGVFCCIIFIILMKLFLFFTILLWRAFAIDFLGRSYNQQTNKMRFNITNYMDYQHRHYRPEN